MDDSKLGHGGGGATVSTSIEPVVIVSEGAGKTANISGAKAKGVQNVSKSDCQLTEYHAPRADDQEQAELYAAVQESKINLWSKESRTIYCLAPLPSLTLLNDS